MSPQTFQDKYMPLAPRLYSMALAILDNAQDAEDAVQEAYLRLWQRADEVTGMDSPEAYLTATLRNVCCNALRQRRHEADLEETDVADTAPPPGEKGGNDRSLWQRLLAGLTPKARRVVTLRHVADCSMHDIATLTGESETNVRAILSRARRRLREAYVGELRNDR